MTRCLAAAFAISAVLLAACASGEPSAVETTTTTSTTATTTTTSTAATSAPTTALAQTGFSPIEQRTGLGDSRYAELGNSGYDVAEYAIDLTFDPEPNTISALVEITAEATEPLQSFSLDFVGFDILAVKVDDQLASYERTDGELIIVIPDPVAAGDQFTTSVRYEGSPEPIRSQALPFDVGWRRDSDGTAYVIAEPDGGRSWLPLNDHPSDKATYTFSLTVPDPLIAAANGVLVERITDLGWSTWVWKSASPMASYLATVVIGDLEIVEDTVSTATSGVAVRNVLPRDLGPTSRSILNGQGEMIAYFSDLWGPYPFAAYGIAIVDGFEAALENQTLSIFGRDFVDDSQSFETVLVHELAHQWFGNSVTPNDWGDIWLNEGFATYAEWLWIEEKRGDAALQSTVAGARNQMALAAFAPPGSPPANDLFNASVYVRGGLVLHALRAQIGDEAFFETLRTYLNQNRDDTVTTNDFIAVAESVSGADLNGLFAEWLYGESVPQLP